MLLEPVKSLAPGCISDLAFDRWRGGELDATGCLELTQHLEQCRACTARRDAFDAAAQQFLGRADYPRDVPRLRAELRQRRQRSRVAMTAAAAAAATILFWWPSSPQQHRMDRLKGGPSLGFYVRRGDEVFRGRTGEQVRPGDQLRFTWRSDRPAYLAILSLDAARTVSTYYPPPNAREVLVPTGNEVALEGAVELDAMLGPERLFAISCDRAPNLDTLREQLSSTQQLSAPPNCQIQQLDLFKEPQP